MSGKFSPKSFGRQLRNAREELGITQEEMSARSRVGDDTKGISEPYISLLERGLQEGRPTDEYLTKIARALGKDELEVKAWAGITPHPDWSTTLRAIELDRNLTRADKDLISAIYLRIAPPRAT